MAIDLQQITIGGLGAWVIYYTITNNTARENKYIETIQTLTNELNVVNEIKNLLIKDGVNNG